MDDGEKAQTMADTGTQLYEELMRFRPEGLSPNAWAVQAGVSRTIWQDLKRHGNPSRRTLEKLLAAAGSSLAEFEALRVGRTSAGQDEVAGRNVGEGERGFRGAEPQPVPVIWCKSVGEWGHHGSGITMIGIDGNRVLDLLQRPSSLAHDARAYVLSITDNAMWPRFRPGRKVLVSPASPIEPGDDVLVKIARGGTEPPLSLLKHLEGRSANSLQLRQFAPDMSFEVPLGNVEFVHKVLGELI